MKSILKNSHCERCSLTLLRRQLPPRPQPWLPELLTTGLQQGLRKAGPPIPWHPMSPPDHFLQIWEFVGNIWQHMQISWCKSHGSCKENQTRIHHRTHGVPKQKSTCQFVMFVPIQQVLVISFGFLMTDCVLVTLMTLEMRSLAKVVFDLRHWRGIEKFVRRYRPRMMNEWWMCWGQW